MTEMPGAIADEKNGIICELLHDLIAEYWTLQNTTFIENIGHCYNIYIYICVVFKLWKFVSKPSLMEFVSHCHLRLPAAISDLQTSKIS